MTSISVSMIFSMLAYICVLFAFHEFARRYLKSVTVLFFLMLFSIPFWGDHLEGWFRWAKSLSVIIPVSFLNITRLAHRHPIDSLKAFTKKWPMWTLYVVILVNIMQATIKDFTLGNTLNGTVGLIVALTMPITPDQWKIEKETKFNDFIFNFTTFWCFLYTIWNIAFVYGEKPAYVAHVTCILLVPLAYAVVFKRPDLWYSARAYTLGLSLFFRSAYDFITPAMDSSAWHDSDVLHGWGLLNLCIAVPYLLIFVYSKIKHKIPKTD